MKMTGYELLEMIEQRNGGDITATIEDANELLRQLYEDSKKLGYDLERELEQKSISENKCYLCSSELTYERHLQYSEYQGKQVSEEINKCVCSNCEYIVES